MIPSPSARRLIGFIRERSIKDSVYWTRLNLKEIAAYFELTPRTLARAKAELEKMKLVKFRTVSNGKGRGHKLYACMPHKLVGKRGELLHQTRDGRARIARTKIGGRVINKPKLNERPHDIHIYKGSLREHHDKKTPTVKPSLASKPTSKQVKFAHWLKRELWRRHSWDNCKVMKSDAHAFGFALRAIRAGYDVEEIHRAFEAALKTMHATATDVGLANDAPNQTLFCLSSTVSLAQRSLRQKATAAPSRNIKPPSTQTRQSIDTFNQKRGNKRLAMVTKTRHGTALPCQRARFASIMDALC